MNVPNALTLSRIVMVFVIVGLLLIETRGGGATVAFILFVLAGASDWLDGWWARRHGMISDFGKFMDALADKVLVLGLLIALLAIGALPTWTVLLVLVMLTREFLVTGLRLMAASRGLVLAAERAGKCKTFIQLLCLGAYLAGQALLKDWSCPQTALAFEDFALVLLMVASLLTVTSGVGYVRRYSACLRRGRD